MILFKSQNTIKQYDVARKLKHYQYKGNSQKLTHHLNLNKITIISFEKKTIYKVLFSKYIINYILNYHNV